MFFPLGVPEELTSGPTPPEATTEDSVGAVDPVGMMLAVTGKDTVANTEDDEDDVEEAEEEEMVLLVVVVAVLCFESICRMSTSGSLIRVAISA